MCYWQSVVCRGTHTVSFQIPAKGGGLVVNDGRFTAAVAYASEVDEASRPHYLKRAWDMLADIEDLDNLSTPDLVTLVALLIPTHSRVLALRAGRSATEVQGDRVLRLVVPHGEPPAELSE